MANAARLSWCRTSQPKFWPKNPVTKVSGRKTVARMVSCSIVLFCWTLTFVCSTEITAMLASSTVPSRSRWAGDLLVDQQQVVVDVTGVRLQLRGFGGALDGGDDHGEQRVDGAVEAGGLAAQRVDP